MIPGLQPIPLKDLEALSSPKSWILEGFLDELSSLTPVRGTVIAEHYGESLKIKGSLHVIVDLICDRCLGHFNQSLTFNSEELIFIGEQHKLEANIQLDEFSEHISPLSSFDPERWAFEQLNLLIPLRKLCDKDCKGLINTYSNHQFSTSNHEYNDQEQLDPRWSELEKLLKP